MRIVTRPDFDGIVCAALLYEAEPITKPIKWVQPNDMQKGLVTIESDDIIANLPYNAGCSLWFDHHVTNKPGKHFRGAFRIAPSAARVIFEYYDGRYQKDFEELVSHTDDIDSANLNADQILHPEKYPYVLLSMTISGRNENDASYWRHLVQLLRYQTIHQIMQHPEIISRCKITVSQNNAFHHLLKKHTYLDGHVAVTDFRPCHPAPEGNRFLAYSLFPEAVVSVKIRYHDNDCQKIILSLGHSIVNRNCNVNVGKLLSTYGGGGHAGAGACTFTVEKADDYIDQIIDILKNNKSA